MGPVESLAEGVIGAVEVDGRQIAYVRWGADVFAFRDICPHQSARLSEGKVSPRLVSQEVGRLEVSDVDPVVRCPWHSWEFELRSGRSLLLGDAYRFAVYPVDVGDGRAAIILQDRGRLRRSPPTRRQRRRAGASGYP